MNLLSKHNSFDTIVGIIANGKLRLCLYEITVSTIPKTVSKEQGIARIELWLSTVFNNSFLINEDDSSKETWQKTDHTLLTLPADVNDNTITEVLFLKLTAIAAECNTEIEQVSINNMLEHCTTSMFMENEASQFGAEGWWDESTPSWQHATPLSKDNITTLVTVPDWNALTGEHTNHNSGNVTDIFNKSHAPDEDK